MKLTYFLRLFFAALCMACPVLIAYEISLGGSTYIECKLRRKKRVSRKECSEGLKLTDEKGSAYECFTHPHIPAKEGNSQNWSGYVAGPNLIKPKRHVVTAVYGSWEIPTLSDASHNRWCSLWVGIDGYGSNTVEQLGTEHDWSDGQQHNYAWFQMYPNRSYEIVGFPVSSGDLITASVEYEGDDIFLLSIANLTAGVHTTIPTSYTTVPGVRRSCAEWVLEAPYSGGILPLSDFNTVHFSNCNATISYIHGPINNKHWKNVLLTMATNKGEVKALSSDLTNKGQNFSVTWHHE